MLALIGLILRFVPFFFCLEYLKRGVRVLMMNSNAWFTNEAVRYISSLVLCYHARKRHENMHQVITENKKENPSICVSPHASLLKTLKI